MALDKMCLSDFLSNFMSLMVLIFSQYNWKTSISFEKIKYMKANFRVVHVLVVLESMELSSWQKEINHAC